MTNVVTCFLCYIAVLSLLLASATHSAPSCVDVVSNSALCLPYITNSTDTPSDFCCTGIRNVAGLAKAKTDDVQICNCLKASISGFDYDPKRVITLPQLCKVNISLPPIDNTTDCSKVSFGHGMK